MKHVKGPVRSGGRLGRKSMREPATSFTIVMALRELMLEQEAEVARAGEPTYCSLHGG